MLKNISKIIGIFILGVVGGIFADQILWPYFIERPLLYKYKLDQPPVYISERREIFIQENIALQNAIEKVEKVVVGVKTITKEGKTLEGSGLILTSDGLLVTLADLVPQESVFSFFVDGKKVSFQILKRDLKENLALVKIEAVNLQASGFADFSKLKLGERIFLVGVIFEEDLPLKIVNEGIIKSLNSNVVKTNISEKEMIVGSPLFDIEGNVVGLNFVDSKGDVNAIPITKIKEFSGL